MDWQDTAVQTEFRARVRELLRDRLPAFYRRMSEQEIGEDRGGGWIADRKSDDPERREAAQAWGDAISERGWFAPHWPRDYGGAGLSPNEQFIYRQELALAGAPLVGGSGVRLLGPTLIVHGTEDQRARYLPKILSGETVWAQGYSEPAAGSDLASLQTRAVRRGDEWVINGQKIWTSNAHHADAIFLLTRTDAAAPKHRGISFHLIDDIHTPGLSIRPLINMAWDHEFNEIFFEDVRTPASDVVGEVNRGWYHGVAVLDLERADINGAVGLQRSLERLISYTRTEAGKRPANLTHAVRHEIAERYLETAVGQNFSLRIVSMQNAGQIPNYEASVTKLFISESSQRIARTGTRVFGLYSNIWDANDERAPAKAAFTRRYVTTIPDTIEGGTSEIQRNIIATRGLGLPRS